MRIFHNSSRNLLTNNDYYSPALRTHSIVKAK